MTGREVLERRVELLRRMACIGFGLYVGVAVGVYFLPWLAFFVPVAILVCVATAWLAFDSLRCVRCRGKLGNLLLVRQEGRLFALPDDLKTCPHCGLDLDDDGAHEGLPEFLGAYDNGGEKCGVVGVPLCGALQEYELGLCGDAAGAFQRIFQLQPFGRAVSGYRHFFVPSSRISSRGATSPGILTVRVERGEERAVLEVNAPPALVRALEWLSSAMDPRQVVALRVKSA